MRRVRLPQHLTFTNLIYFSRTFPQIMHANLPEPESAALEHSARLAELLHARIAAAGGWISFADYMRSALYEPGLGYYSAGAAKFGAAGDFVTAPEISPLFSQCLARQCAELLESCSGSTILELGGGTGRMAADMLDELARLDAVPEHYLILEPGAELRDRQARTIQSLPTALRSRVSWLDALPEKAFAGIIVGNEVVDALPVQRFLIDGDEISEVGVASAGAEFTDRLQPAGGNLTDFVEQLDLQGARAYSSEYNPDLKAWVASLAEVLEAGAVLFLDYGYVRREYYMPERSAGTLRCYYRHRAHDNPYLWPGLQDITAWVDFTGLAHAAESAGLNVAGYTTQAQFLLAGGLEELVAGAADSADTGDYVNPVDYRAQAEMAAGLRTLMLPGEMGDAVKAILMTRGKVRPPSGFAGRDLRTTLMEEVF